MTIGESIKTERKKAGLTPKELGQRIGITYQTVAKWENGGMCNNYTTHNK